MVGAFSGDGLRANSSPDLVEQVPVDATGMFDEHAVTASGEPLIEGPPAVLPIDPTRQPPATAILQHPEAGGAATNPEPDPGEIPGTSIVQTAETPPEPTTTTTEYGAAVVWASGQSDDPDSEDNQRSGGLPKRDKPQATDAPTHKLPKESAASSGDKAAGDDRDRDEGYPQRHRTTTLDDGYYPRQAVSDKVVEPSETEATIRRTGQLPTPMPELATETRAIADEISDQLLANGSEIVARHGIEPARDFGPRLQREASSLHSRLVNGEFGFHYENGDYSRDKFAMKPEEMAVIPEDRDYETFLESEIGKRLGEADPNRSTPIIVLDIGGCRGVSWSRLATTYAEQIHEGKVVFVVTTLTNRQDHFVSYHLPNRHLNKDGVDPHASLLKNAKEKRLVHFVNSTFHGLPDVAIPLPSGEMIRLEGNVDITNEVMSMSLHSQIPEISIPEALRVMAPGGMYLVGGGEIQPDDKYFGPGGSTRSQGVRNTHAALVSSGKLTRKDMPTEGAYGWSIFRRPRNT